MKWKKFMSNLEWEIRQGNTIVQIEIQKCIQRITSCLNLENESDLKLIEDFLKLTGKSIDRVLFLERDG